MFAERTRRSRCVFACACDDDSGLLAIEEARITSVGIRFESNAGANDVIYVSFQLGRNSEVIHRCCN